MFKKKPPKSGGFYIDFQAKKSLPNFKKIW